MNARLLSFAFVASAVLAACGGGSSAPAGTPPPPVVPPPAPGITVLAGQLGGNGNLDATGTAARFAGAADIAIDRNGDAYVAETSGLIRKVSATGSVTTVAGHSGAPQGQDGTGRAAAFAIPSGIAVDGSGNMVIADAAAVRRMTPAGVVTTLAGGESGFADGDAATARFGFLKGVTTDPDGSIYVADFGNRVIRRITAAGVVSTVAGKPGGDCSYSGRILVCTAHDGAAGTATFVDPTGVARDASGNLYVADGPAVRKVTPDGAVSTLAGQINTYGETRADGTGAAARFGGAQRIVLDRDGNLLVSEPDAIRKVTPAGAVTTVASGLVSAAGLTLDASGNLLVAASSVIDKVSPTGAVSVVAGTPTPPGVFSGGPAGAGLDASGNLYMAGFGGYTVLKVTPAGQVSVVGGVPNSGGYIDGPAPTARLGFVGATALDAAGNIYAADGRAIRKIAPDGSIATLAGDAEQSGHADGSGAQARFQSPAGIALDSAGNVYVADASTIRRITPQGVVTTLAGVADASMATVDGQGAAARFGTVSGLVFDTASGVLYATDAQQDTVRRITLDGTVTTVAGMPGQAGAADGTGAAARFSMPCSITSDGAGNLYVADTANHTIRKVSASGVVTTVAGRAGSEGVLLGTLPGSLASPSQIVWAGANKLYVRSEGALLAIQLP